MIDTNWDARFYKAALEVATYSKDPVRQVGAVIVNSRRRKVGEGYNGFPIGIKDDGRLEDKDFKRLLMIHAEINAILNATASIEGCALYVTRFPCERCAPVIIQAGIRRVVSPPAEVHHEHWGKGHYLARAWFEEAGVDMSNAHLLGY